MTFNIIMLIVWSILMVVDFITDTSTIHKVEEIQKYEQTDFLSNIIKYMKGSRTQLLLANIMVVLCEVALIAVKCTGGN